MKSFLFASCFLWQLALLAQSHVTEISGIDNPNEISICLDEKNPLNMVAGANINSLYTSRDGGLSWSRSEQTSPYGVWGDPVLIQDTTGSFYHFHLSRVPGGNWIDRIVCQRSDDGGKTFNDGTYFGLNGTKAQDKPWAVVNPANNEIYVTWTQFDEYDSKDPKDRSNILFAKSADQGMTWSEPITINSVDGNCLDDDDTVEGAVPAVGPNGEVYVAWSGPNGLVFNRSMDGGENWGGEETRISDHPGGWNIDIPGIYRANGMPVTKCDLSGGENHGTIYVNWADQRNGTDNTDIFLAMSQDKGETWCEPVKVNQDTTASHQFFTWMDIDQINGNLWFVYHDRRNGGGSATNVYVAVSADGGKTFRESKISESPFFPEKDKFFGDYNNIAAHSNIVRPVWTRLDSTDLRVMTGIVDVEALLSNKSRLIQTETNAVGSLMIKGCPEEATTIVIRDLSGKEILSSNEINVKTGGFTVPKTAKLPKGIYHIELGSGDGKIKGRWVKR